MHRSLFTMSMLPLVLENVSSCLYSNLKIFHWTDRQTDKTNCLIPSRMCARGIKIEESEKPLVAKN